MKNTSAYSLKGLAIAVLAVLFSAICSFAQNPAGVYKITVKCGRLSKNADRAFKGSTLYLKKHNFSSQETTVIDSAVINRRKAVFYGPSYPLDTKASQDNVFTAGQFEVCDSEGTLFSFFYSSDNGDSFSTTFRQRLSASEHFYTWETDGNKATFGKENIYYLDFQNYLSLRDICVSQDRSEALAAEYTVNTLYPGTEKAVIKRILFQAENNAPGSLTCILLDFALNGFTSQQSSQLPMIADERLLYTSFWKKHIDLFLDKFKLSKESIRNMAIDYLMENRYLTDPKMRAATAMECFRRYSSSVVMGCEGSAVYAAEKYILGNDAVSEKDRAEAAWFVTVNKGTLVGAKAPELKLKDTAGVAHSIREMMGTYSIIYFYSDDCNFCKEETPRFIEFLDNYDFSMLNVMTVYTGTDSEAWKKYVRDNFTTMNPLVNWIHVADIDRESRFPVDYGVVSTPKMFLLDQSLRIMGRGILTPTLSRILEEEKQNTIKANDYLYTIFSVPNDNPQTFEETEETWKGLVDRIYQGSNSSEENYRRLMRQTFMNLYFRENQDGPAQETAAYLGQKYILDMSERWEDTVFVESVRSAVRYVTMNRPDSKAENLLLYDIADNPSELLPNDGKYKVLFFYRSDCGVCKQAVSDVKSAWKKYGRQVDFIGIYAGENISSWRKFVVDNNLEFRQLYDKDHRARLEEYYYVESVPQILLVNPDNTIRIKDFKEGMVYELEDPLSFIVPEKTKKK